MYLRRIFAAQLRKGTPYGGCPICRMSIMRKLPQSLLDGNKREKCVKAIDNMLSELVAAAETNKVPLH